MLLDKESPLPINTCAIIISYHPTRQIIDRIQTISIQVNEVVIIDNKSNILDVKYLDKIVEKTVNIHLILNDENLGIAAALNIGVKYALKQNYQWILTLDQDSIVSSNFLESMSLAYQACTNKNAIASICPVLGLYDQDDIDKNDRIVQHRQCFQSDREAVGIYTLTKRAITSGNLVKLEVFKTVGFFDEDFFIDYVDHEFCLRLHRHGYKIIQSNHSLLYHNIGFPKEHNFLGRKIQTSNHSSLRRYYLARNAIITYKRYFISDIVWIIKDIRILLSYIIKIVLFEENKIEQLKSVLLGFLHGIRGKTGKLNEKYLTKR